MLDASIKLREHPYFASRIEWSLNNSCQSKATAKAVAPLMPHPQSFLPLVIKPTYHGSDEVRGWHELLGFERRLLP